VITDLETKAFVAHSVESPFRRRVIELFGRNRTTLNMPSKWPTIKSINASCKWAWAAIVPRIAWLGNRSRLDERK